MGALDVCRQVGGTSVPLGAALTLKCQAELVVRALEHLLKGTLAAGFPPYVQDRRGCGRKIWVKLLTSALAYVRTQSSHRLKQKMAVVANGISLEAIPAFLPD